MPDISGLLARAWQSLQGGNHIQAEQLYRQAIEANPYQIEAWTGLGGTLAAAGRFDQAAQVFRLLLQFLPNAVAAWSDLGIMLQHQSKHDEALACFRRAVQLDPDNAAFHQNMGSALLHKEQYDEAIACYRRALELQPDFAEARANLAFAFNVQGRVEEALSHHEQAGAGRSHRDEAWVIASTASFAQPSWDGSALGGRSILLHSTDGYGDIIQCIRYAPLVQRAGGKVLFQCPAPLMRLLATAPGIDSLVVQGSELPPFDVQASLLSLPKLFKADLADMAVPYLSANAPLMETWRQRLASVEGFKVGMAWQGNRKHQSDLRRSIPLRQFERLAAVPGVRLVSLQKEAGREQLQNWPAGLAIHDVADSLVDFMETAAVIRNLDLVISCDTAVAHLAGALGCKVWVALHEAPDRRWLAEREDSPWYPQARLFRQRLQGNWDEVFERMAGELRKLTRVGEGV
jgi:Flp pilus assembly protein TadD